MDAVFLEPLADCLHAVIDQAQVRTGDHVVVVAAGSMEAAKSAGKIRVEGKDYLVREGDILQVRFAV